MVKDDYFCNMKQWQVLKTVFPEVITENFEFVNCEESADRLDYWLDERGYMSREDYKKGTVREYGFTEERVIQDFPFEGNRFISMCDDASGVIRKTGVSLLTTTN